ncbi:MAG: DUF423 domain-containing protein [Alphaproteobacteria bacterium]
MLPIWILIAAVDGAAFVVIGAAGSHGVIADPSLGRLFDTASDNHAVHALALLAIGFAGGRLNGAARGLVHTAAAAFLIGSGLFSGLLYFHAFAGSSPLPWLTPIGGALMILGWLALAAAGAVTLRRSPAD